MTAPHRIGLFGGSFNPVHLGHLTMAEHARAQLDLDQVLLAPAGNPPHKAGQRLAPVTDRLEMVRLAIADNDALVASDLDVTHSEPSFTWSLLERLRAAHPAAELWFLMGGDSLADFQSWARPDRILELARLAVVERPGFIVNVNCGDRLMERVDHVEAPLSTISSTDIRDRIRAQTTVRYLIPEAVRAYIDREGLYR
ncbi:MAG: nicotinate (nicotinamide) nucleotide adenylyltransferase [Chloroflexia bacterium]|nr:nicotinate (nicotinamide) nucleotide adenylyltransferase [Chloroflexia bacterium]